MMVTPIIEGTNGKDFKHESNEDPVGEVIETIMVSETGELYLQDPRDSTEIIEVTHFFTKKKMSKAEVEIHREQSQV